MATKVKTFDCIEMKRRAQEKLQAEYESRKSEFPSYVDFLNAKAEQSDLGRWLRSVATPRKS